MEYAMRGFSRFFFQSTLSIMLGVSSFSTLHALTVVNSVNKTGIDTSGNVFKIWDGTFTEEGQFIYVVRNDTVNSWNTPEIISPAEAYSFGSMLGVLPNGNAIAVWLTIDLVNGCNVLYSSTYVSGSWSPAVAHSPVTETALPSTYSVTIDDSNNVTLLWEAIELSDFTTRSLRSVTCVLGSAWGTPETVTIIQ